MRIPRPSLPKELGRYAVQLERQEKLIAIGGEGLCVRVADPAFLRELLEDAMMEIIEHRQARKLPADHPFQGETQARDG